MSVISATAPPNNTCFFAFIGEVMGSGIMTIEKKIIVGSSTLLIRELRENEKVNK